MDGKIFYSHGLSLNSAQLRNIFKGKPINLKNETLMAGGSIVHFGPVNAKKIAKAVRNNKGVRVEFSDNEIHKNIVDGSGIFGKAGDRVLKKLGVRDAAYKAGDIVKPIAKKALLAGVTAGVGAIVASNPELAPFAPMAIAGATSLGNDFMDHPSKYNSVIGNGLDDWKKTSRAIGKAGQSSRGRKVANAITDKVIQGISNVGSGMKEDWAKTTKAIGRAGQSSRGRKVANAITDKVIQGISNVGNGLDDWKKTSRAINKAGQSSRGRKVANAITDKVIQGISNVGTGFNSNKIPIYLHNSYSVQPDLDKRGGALDRQSPYSHGYSTMLPKWASAFDYPTRSVLKSMTNIQHGGSFNAAGY